MTTLWIPGIQESKKFGTRGPGFFSGPRGVERSRWLSLSVTRDGFVWKSECLKPCHGHAVFSKGPYVIRLIHMAYHSYWCAHSAATAGLYVYSDKFGNISLCMSEPFEFVIWSQLGNGLLQEKIYAQILCGKCLNLPAYLMHQPVLSYALPFLSPHRTCAQRWFTDFSFSPAATCHCSSTQASRAQPWMLAERAPRRDSVSTIPLLV
jgi:hypothetical protein